jgi:hypothetical protein
MRQATNISEDQFKDVLGGYNDPLPNMVELTEKEFARASALTYPEQLSGYRQIVNPKFNNGKVLSLTFFVTNRQDMSGWAISTDYWAGKVRFFKFAACRHEFRESGPEDWANGVPKSRMCLSVSVCKKCGYVREIDSSD